MTTIVSLQKTGIVCADQHGARSLFLGKDGLFVLVEFARFLLFN